MTGNIANLDESSVNVFQKLSVVRLITRKIRKNTLGLTPSLCETAFSASVISLPGKQLQSHVLCRGKASEKFKYYVNNSPLLCTSGGDIAVNLSNAMLKEDRLSVKSSLCLQKLEFLK